MPRTLTPIDGHAIMTALFKQATGIDNVTSFDASSFISVGERVMQTGMENVLNSLNIVLGRTLVAARPYSAKVNKMQAIDTGVYSSRMRKISFYSKYPVADGRHNTNLYTNLANGFTNGQNPDAQGTAQSTKSMWEQHQPMPAECWFGGSTVWQDCITTYEDQLQTAFRSVEDFTRFVAGYLTVHGNDIEMQKESFNRMLLLNKIASTYYYDSISATQGQVINLTAAYNARFGTSYTSAQLRSTYLKEFLAFFVATFKNESAFMTEMSAYRHLNFAKTVNGEDYAILRHTPFNRQRVYLYGPLFKEAEALVLPEIFRPGYLDLETQYEEVNYWQGISSRAEIDVTPAVIDLTTGTQIAAPDPVQLDYVVGAIMDEDALMTNYQLDAARTTPVEARKGYYNTWLSIAKNGIDDGSENCVIFIMADPTEP